MAVRTDSQISYISLPIGRRYFAGVDQVTERFKSLGEEVSPREAIAHAARNMETLLSIPLLGCTRAFPLPSNGILVSEERLTGLGYIAWRTSD
jgi:hypothetical protein